MEELSVGAVPSKASWRDLRVKRSTLLQMKEFISDLGVIPSASGPMKIFSDNTGAIALAKETKFHKRTKHMKEMLQFHPSSSVGRGHRDLQDTQGSECCRPVD